MPSVHFSCHEATTLGRRLTGGASLNASLATAVGGASTSAGGGLIDAFWPPLPEPPPPLGPDSAAAEHGQGQGPSPSVNDVDQDSDHDHAYDAAVFCRLIHQILEQIDDASAQSVAVALWAHRAVHQAPLQALMDQWARRKLGIVAVDLTPGLGPPKS